MSESGQVPVRESVGAALRFVRERWQFIAVAAAIGAVASTAIGAAQLAAPAAAIIFMVLSGLVQAGVYAALVSAALGLGTAGLINHAFRVWAAMVVIGFFLFIVVFVMTIPVAIALAAGPLAPYAEQLQAAGADETAVMTVMMRFAQENPGAMLSVMALYAVVWLGLTSRLYLAAPATVDQARILSFETWPWTKGALLRITATRFMLLAPAYILVSAIGYLIGRPFGIDGFDPSSVVAMAENNRAIFLAYALIQSFLTLGVYSALEAGLSAYLYKGLKPGDQAAPG